MAIGIIIKGEVKPNLSSVIKQLLRFSARSCNLEPRCGVFFW